MFPSSRQQGESPYTRQREPGGLQAADGIQDAGKTRRSSSSSFAFERKTLLDFHIYQDLIHDREKDSFYSSGHMRNCNT
ncbi:hypothetical protein NQZ68_012959 [Dissostichus eleginoides]|nr:hypothetical protein NQZ68_012959 [Dissostichus eleginoides]